MANSCVPKRGGLEKTWEKETGVENSFAFGQFLALLGITDSKANDRSKQGIINEGIRIKNKGGLE